VKRISISICCLMLLSIQALGQNYRLPAGARIIETQPLKERGYHRRALLLWMVRPGKHPRDPLDEGYTCPEETRGSYFSGPTRASLYDLDRGRIINTIKIRQEYYDQVDTFDLPFRIHAGSYYRVPGVPKGREGRPRLMWLRDYNGDGKALEFALFDALACMGLASTLIGYSERQDRVIQYPIRLRLKGGRKRISSGHWGDYLFGLKPCAPGYWKYEIDYRGRGGSLNKYEIRYNARTERFEGRYEWIAEAHTFVPYYLDPRRCAK
jgi:hypothetical protein